MSISQAIPYIDAEARVTGRVEFVINLSLPGMLHAAVHRSPYPHARIVSIDTRAAEAVPGVVAVLTRDDLVNNPEINTHFGPILRDQPVLAIDRVRFVGEPVAAVAAADREIAEHAAELIEVEYEELPAVFDIEAALAPGAVLLYDPPLGRDQSRTPVVLRDVTGTNVCNYFVVQKGDAERALASADYVFEDVFTTPTQQHVPLEAHVTVAHVSGREVTVWSATQTPYVIRATLAELFNLPQNRVHVKVATLGGGYGGKTQPKLEPLAAALAWKAGAPVRLALSRSEEFVTITKHASRITLRTGVNAAGEIVAKVCELLWNGGAYADRSPTVAEAAALVATGPYRAPHVYTKSTAVYTNLPPAGAFRGFGAAQVAWAYESQMDMIAARLGLDPVEFRRRNLLRPGDEFATGERLHDVAFEALLDDAAAAVEWGRPTPKTSGGPARRSVARGKGVAITLKGMITPSTATAVVRLNPDGSATVLSSTVEMGQGSKTVLAQMAADVLGLPYDQVSVVNPDTDVTPYDLSTNSSRSTFAMGDAVTLAATDARRQAVELAAKLLGAEPARLEARDGAVQDPGTGRSLTYGQIIRAARVGNIVGTGTHRTEGELDPDTGQGLGSTHWHHAATGAEVEVDRETGQVRVLRLHTAIYTGRSINPANVELQTEGNMTFGLGKALMEALVFDNGQALNATLSEYMIPSFLDVPPTMTVRQVENPDPNGEVHGVGETGLPPIAPAIGNAIYNALGVRVRDLPITPEKLWAALQREAAGEAQPEGAPAAAEPEAVPE